MACSDLVRHFGLVGLLVAGCGDDGGRGDPQSTGPTTSPVTSTTAGTNATQTGDPSEAGSSDPSTTVDPSSSGEPTTEGTTDPTDTTTDPTDPTDPTDTGDATPVCSYSCVSDTDCTVNGSDIGFDCLGGECVPGCASDDPCVAFHSGWTLTPCTASSQCDFDVCVVYEGGSGCALTPAVGACTNLDMVEGQRMDTEGNMVTVCTQPTATCIDIEGTMQCHVPCTAASCGGLTCGADGFCGCDDFVPCYSEGIGDYCTADGKCEYACSSPADCPETNIDADQSVCD